MQSLANAMTRLPGPSRVRRTSEGLHSLCPRICGIFLLGVTLHIYLFRSYMPSLLSLPYAFNISKSQQESSDHWSDQIMGTLHNVSQKVDSIEPKLSAHFDLKLDQHKQHFADITDRQTEAITHLKHAVTQMQEGHGGGEAGVENGAEKGAGGGERGISEVVSSPPGGSPSSSVVVERATCARWRRGESEKKFLAAMIMVRIFKADLFNITFDHLKQWMAYVHYGGVEHIYVYDAAIHPEEKLEAQIQPLVAAGLVTYHHYETLFPDHEQANFGEGYDPLRQPNSYAHCLQTYGPGVEHILQADLDEFPFSTRDSALGFIARAVRNAHESHTGVHRGDTGGLQLVDIRRRRLLQLRDSVMRGLYASWRVLGMGGGRRRGREEDERGLFLGGRGDEESREGGSRLGRGSEEARRRKLLRDGKGHAPIGQLLMQCLFFEGYGDASKTILMERFTRRRKETAGDFVGWASRMKAIYRPDSWIADTRIDAHSAEVFGETLVFDPDALRLNHYWGPRQQEWGPDTPQLLEETVEDYSILPIADALRMEKYSFGGCLPPEEDW